MAVGSGSTTRMPWSENRKKSRMLNDVPGAEVEQNISASSVSRCLRRRVFWAKLGLAASRKFLSPADKAEVRDAGLG